VREKVDRHRHLDAELYRDLAIAERVGASRLNRRDVIESLDPRSFGGDPEPGEEPLAFVGQWVVGERCREAVLELGEIGPLPPAIPSPYAALPAQLGRAPL